MDEAPHRRPRHARRPDRGARRRRPRVLHRLARATMRCTCATRRPPCSRCSSGRAPAVSAIQNLAVKGADLEDVFLSLTGREYRDEFNPAASGHDDGPASDDVPAPHHALLVAGLPDDPDDAARRCSSGDRSTPADHRGRPAGDRGRARAMVDGARAHEGLTVKTAPDAATATKKVRDGDEDAALVFVPKRRRVVRRQALHVEHVGHPGRDHQGDRRSAPPTGCRSPPPGGPPALAFQAVSVDSASLSYIDFLLPGSWRSRS